jgi:hypothetical protein
MKASLFRSLDSAAMAKDIRAAQHSVCYAAPGIQDEPAKAMAEVAERSGLNSSPSASTSTSG